MPLIFSDERKQAKNGRDAWLINLFGSQNERQNLIREEWRQVDHKIPRLLLPEPLRSKQRRGQRQRGEGMKPYLSQFFRGSVAGFGFAFLHVTDIFHPFFWMTECWKGWREKSRSEWEERGRICWKKRKFISTFKPQLRTRPLHHNTSNLLPNLNRVQSHFNPLYVVLICQLITLKC